MKLFSIYLHYFINIYFFTLFLSYLFVSVGSIYPSGDLYLWDMRGFLQGRSMVHYSILSLSNLNLLNNPNLNDLPPQCLTLTIYRPQIWHKGSGSPLGDTHQI